MGDPIPHQCQCGACHKAPNAFSRLHAQMNWFMSKLDKDQRRWYGAWNQIVPEKLALAGLRSSLVSASQQSVEVAGRFPTIQRGYRKWHRGVVGAGVRLGRCIPTSSPCSPVCWATRLLATQCQTSGGCGVAHDDSAWN